MAKAQYRVYFDNAPASPEQLALLGEIRIDQGMGVAAEAQIELAIGTDSAGRWSVIEESYAQAFVRVRIEVQVAEADFLPLIDGLIVGSHYEMMADPDHSRMTLVVHDDSVQLDRDEKVVLFEDMAPHDIASTLFAGVGLMADVDVVAGAGSALQRAVVQRGTDMQLLLDLARRHGMFAYVRPGSTPGASVGVFKRPQFDAVALPEIRLLGNDRNVSSFPAEFDALRPIRARAGSVALADKRVLTSSIDAGSLAALGDRATHDITQPAITLLTGTREEQADLDAATAAVVNLSSWAYAAQGELDADHYAGVLQPYRLVRVRGIGGYLSGDYLVGRVMHVLTDQGYRQRFSLHRNVRSAGSAGSGSNIPSGVF